MMAAPAWTARQRRAMAPARRAAPRACVCMGRPPRCAWCFDRAIERHGGAAGIRGRQWAKRVADQVGTSKPWPPMTKTGGIARRLVADMTTDPRILEALAIRCHLGARDLWLELRGEKRFMPAP